MARITTTITAEFDPTTADEQGEYTVRYDADVTVSEDFPRDVDPQGLVEQSVMGFLSRIVDTSALVDPELDAEGPTPESLTEEEN